MPYPFRLSCVALCLFFFFESSSISRAGQFLGFYGYIYRIEAFGSGPTQPPISYPQDGPWFSYWDRCYLSLKTKDNPQVVTDEQDVVPWILTTKNGVSQIGVYTWKFYNQSFLNPDYRASFATRSRRFQPVFETKTLSALQYQDGELWEEWSFSAVGIPPSSVAPLGKYELRRIAVDMEGEQYQFFPWDHVEAFPFRIPREELHTLARRRFVLTWKNPETGVSINTSVHITHMY